MFDLLKKLAGQTAVYGLSTIIGRLLNYLLVPFYTRIFLPDEYGVITELYSYVAFLLILLTYGLETGYFRHARKVKSENVLYSSLLFILFLSSTVFILFISIYKGKIASLIGYSAHGNYILYLSLIVALDAFLALPFAKLRNENKALRFAIVKLLNISINIGLNLFFYLLLPRLDTQTYGWLLHVFPVSNSVKYVFISNLAASIITFFLLLPEILKFRLPLDFALMKKVFAYSFPLLLVGLTGMAIDSLDKILLKHLVTIPADIKNATDYAMAQVGIYGANFKLAVFMSLFIQAFRFAAEPIFFAEADKTNAKAIYAEVMKFFVILGLFIFLAITLYLDIVRHFIDSAYFAGLLVVPWLLLAKLFFGLVFNLSIWYKLTNKTIYGLYISLSGASVSIILNILLIPIYSYYGCAIAAFFAYLTMIIVSYAFSRKFYPIPYSIKEILFYFLIGITIFMISKQTYFSSEWLYYSFNTVLLLIFAGIVIWKEKFIYHLKRKFLK